MKNRLLKSFAGFSLVLVIFSGCDLFEDAADVTFDVELTHTFVIDETFNSNNNPVTYVDGDSWDPTDEPEFEKYKDKIKEITVNSVTYTVTDYAATGSVLFSNGKGSFKTSAGAATAIAVASITIQDIQAAQGGTHSLAYAIADLNSIADQLEKIEPIYFEVSGTLSKTPVAFKVPVTINATIKASALK